MPATTVPNQHCCGPRQTQSALSLRPLYVEGPQQGQLTCGSFASTWCLGPPPASAPPEVGAKRTLRRLAPPLHLGAGRPPHQARSPAVALAAAAAPPARCLRRKQCAAAARAVPGGCRLLRWRCRMPRGAGAPLRPKPGPRGSAPRTQTPARPLRQGAPSDVRKSVPPPERVRSSRASAVRHTAVSAPMQPGATHGTACGGGWPSCRGCGGGRRPPAARP